MSRVNQRPKEHKKRRNKPFKRSICMNICNIWTEGGLRVKVKSSRKSKGQALNIYLWKDWRAWSKRDRLISRRLNCSISVPSSHCFKITLSIWLKCDSFSISSQQSLISIYLFLIFLINPHPFQLTLFLMEYMKYRCGCGSWAVFLKGLNRIV